MDLALSANSLSDISNIVTIGSAVGSVLLGVFAIWRRIDRRQAKTEQKVEMIDARLDRIEKQFGPNGGGLREAVNNIASIVDKIDDRTTKLGNDVARLSGQFDQHMIEND